MVSAMLIIKHWQLHITKYKTKLQNGNLKNLDFNLLKKEIKVFKITIHTSINTTEQKKLSTTYTCQKT